jgi:chromatin-remodeling ATPase INO80
MTGAPPYGVRSPSQKQSSYNAYSPPSKNMSYYPNNEPYQHPPETPQPYPAPNSYTRSPHFAHPSSPLSTALPPLNGNAPSHSDTSSPYQPQHSAATTPQLPLPRPFSTSIMAGSTQSAFGPSTISHSHPAGRSEALSQSPKKESDLAYDGRSNGINYSPQTGTLRELPPRSPKESVGEKLGLVVEIALE